MWKLAERTKTRKTSERITKAKQFRMLAKGYKALKKDKATAYQAAAEALEQVEQRSAQMQRKKALEASKELVAQT